MCEAGERRAARPSRRPSGSKERRCTTIIRPPLITEKTTHPVSSKNQFGFEVALGVSKPQITAAVESCSTSRFFR